MSIQIMRLIELYKNFEFLEKKEMSIFLYFSMMLKVFWKNTNCLKIF